MWDIWKSNKPMAMSIKMWVILTASIISVPGVVILVGILIPLLVIAFAHPSTIHILLTISLIFLACGITKFAARIGWGVYDDIVLDGKDIDREYHMAVYSQITMVIVSVVIVLAVIADIFIYRMTV